MKIPISKILVDHDKNVSRQKYSDEENARLAESIGKYGLIQPVTVKPIPLERGFEYQLVVGYRRIIACLLLGLETVDAFVRKNVDEHMANVLNVIENLQRENPGYWDQCCALRDTFDPELGDTAIAKELDKSRPWVRARWLVWRLPPDVIAQVEAGLLTAADVTLLIHKSPEEQQAAADRLLQGKAAGETTQQMEKELSNRRTIRPKKEVQAMMTKLLAETPSRMNLVHTLRWAIGEITDTQLMGLINK